MSLLILSVLGCAPECEDTSAGTYTYVVDRYDPDQNCWEAGVAIEVDARYWPGPDDDFPDIEAALVPLEEFVCVMPSVYVYTGLWSGVADDPATCMAEECFDACARRWEDPVWCGT